MLLIMYQQISLIKNKWINLLNTLKNILHNIGWQITRNSHQNILAFVDQFLVGFGFYSVFKNFKLKTHYKII